MLKIFLSGSVKKTFKELNVGKSYWTEDEEEILRKRLKTEVELLNPNTISLDRNNREGRFSADLLMLLESDMVLVDAKEKKGIGIGAEMIFAKQHKIPVYTISPLGSHYHKKYDNGEEWIHPFIYELSDRIFDDLHQFIEYVNELCLRNKLKANQIEDKCEVLDQFNSFDSGYDEGYRQTTLFWDTHPAQYVVRAAELLKDRKDDSMLRCLDLGCGHGKNSIYLRDKGFQVEALDSSYYAIKEARSIRKDIKWKIRDIRKIYDNSERYDLIVLTGCLHCLSTSMEVKGVVETAKKLTNIGGINVVSVFNSGYHDLSGHADTFNPILLSHDEYIEMYRDWKIIESSDVTQEDIHKNNGIQHAHSITRIIAMKYE